MIKYPHLFSTIKLAGTVFRNRIFASPMSGRMLDSQNRPTPEGIAFYERKARGGAAAVCVGDCVVDVENGLFGNPMMSMEDRSPLSHRALNRLTHAVTRYGAVMSAELQHAGLYASASRAAGNTVYGPADGVTADGQPFFEMPEERIFDTIAKFAAAAAWAKQCGFGMVTLHGGHGWLLSQFMSSKVNTRRDKWGGSHENRMRFPLAVIDAVRRAVGADFPIEIRISGSEVTPRGYDLDEGIAIAKALDGHVDLIHVSAGHHEYREVFCVTHPSIFMEDSANAHYAAEIKKHVKTPVATVGAHSNPEIMEELIASGKADVIEIARALLADPDLPRKARSGGDIRPCLRCLQCFSGLITNGQIYCAVNPEIGNETEYRAENPAAVRKNVLIAGGGIAGMQAAVTCAKRGHRVTLAEASGRLGGTLLCETDVPFKSKIRDYIEYQKRELARYGVEVRLNTRVTPDYAESQKPEVIIAALGAQPSKPPIPGIEKTITAEEAYAAADMTSDNVIILGGGLSGVELAVYLAGLGRAVTVMEMAPALNSGGNILHQFALDTRIQECGISVMTGTRAVEVTESGVRYENGGTEGFLEADTVICAAGQSPGRAEAESLAHCAPEFYTAGDCVVPKNITAATASAEAAARIV